MAKPKKRKSKHSKPVRDATRSRSREALPKFATIAEGLIAADAASKDGQADTALAILTDLRERFPDEPEPVLRAARLLKESGRLDEADAALEAGCQKHRRNLGLYIQRAWLAHERRDPAAAAERWAELREAFPDHPVGYAGGAGALRDAGRVDEAEMLTVSAVERFPDDPGVADEHARVALARRDFSEAATRWQQVTERFPDRPRGYRGVGLALRDAGRFDEAESILRAAVARFPDNAEIVVDYAWLAQVRRDWPEAARRWREVRARVPDHQSAFMMGAGALRAIGETDEAEGVLAEAAKRFPKAPQPLLEHARMSLERQDWREAVRRFTKLTENFPEEPGGYVGLAQALSHAGRLDEAEAVLRTAMARFPGETAAFVEYGLVAIRRNDWDAALERALDAQRRFPDDAAIKQRLVEVRRRAAESGPAAIPDEKPGGDAAAAGAATSRAR